MTKQAPRISGMRRYSARARHGVALILISTSLTSAVSLHAQTKELRLTGYLAGRAANQLTIEEGFRARVDTAKLRGFSRILSSEPHVAGTARQRWTAFWVDSLTRSWGLTTVIDSHRVYIPHPVSVTVSRVSPDPKDIVVSEPPIPEDRATQGTIFPAFNAYSGRGEVTAAVVYVGHGLIEDYERLDSIGISVEGKIVVARYGRSYRGIKAREAERNGAAGLILYSDPADDGYVRGDVYPEGPFRPERGVQRGSIKNSPGDPSTPGRPSGFRTERVPENEMEGIAHIPVLPVGYRAAAELLEGLRGAPLPDQSWQGGLPFRYHVGPGPVTAKMMVETEPETAAYHTIYNTLAILPGTTYPNEWVVVGGHRDAWGPGSIDNVSGTASVLELCRVFAELALVDEIYPERTVVFATWDAEEWGLIGSTEFVESIEEKGNNFPAVIAAYVNQDAVASGPNFRAAASGSLKSVVRDVTRTVSDPFSDGAVYDRWHIRQALDEETPARVGDLGGGSDFAGFYNHLGIAAANLGFGGTGGIYHSAYDSYHYMATFGDPNFLAHAGAARTAGTLVLRLANAAILPFDHLEFADQLEELVVGIEQELHDLDAELNTAKLRLGIGDMRAAAIEFATARTQTLAGDRPHSHDWSEVNRTLLEVDKELTRESGLRGRAWYRNLVFASDRDNGYANVPLPGIAEAIRDGSPELAQAEVDDLTKRIRQAALRLAEASLTLAQN